MSGDESYEFLSGSSESDGFRDTSSDEEVMEQCDLDFDESEPAWPESEEEEVVAGVAGAAQQLCCCASCCKVNTNGRLLSERTVRLHVAAEARQQAAPAPDHHAPSSSSPSDSSDDSEYNRPLFDDDFGDGGDGPHLAEAVAGEGDQDEGDDEVEEEPELDLADVLAWVKIKGNL